MGKNTILTMMLPLVGDCASFLVRYACGGIIEEESSRLTDLVFGVL